MHHIDTLILHPDPCQRSSLAIAEEVLATANRLAGLHGLQVRFDIRVTRPPLTARADLVVLPGLGLATPAELCAVTQTQGFQDLAKTLTSLPPGQPLAAACSGVFALGKAGLLRGRRATANWWLVPFLQQQFPDTRFSSDDILVQDGPVTTAGAAFSQIDLMLHLVEGQMGLAVAQDCRSFLMADNRSSQAPYLSVARLVAGDPALLQAEAYARRHLGEPISTGDLAEAAGLGQRTFARRLHKVAAMTPIRFLQTLRINAAIRMVRGSTLSAAEVAHRVGYGDATALRRVMLAHMGKTLEAFR